MFITSPRTARRPRKTVAALAAALSLSLAATGCSSSGDDDDAPAATAEDATRTVTDSEGTQVTVPVHPERPVTLHFNATQSLLSLGVTPVLQATGNLEALLPAEEYAKVKDIPQLDQGDTDIEKIAQADPDLILVPNATEDTTVAQLRDIAPVYVYTHSGKGRSDWKGRSDEIADAMNLNGKLDDVKARLADRQSQIATEHGETLGKIRAALFTVGGSRGGGSSAGGFGIAGPDSMSGRVLGPAGLRWDDRTTDLTAGIDGQSLSLSDEQITSTLSDADVLFYATDIFGEGTPELETMRGLAAFQDLPAAQAGKVYPVGKQLVAGYMDAFNNLDFLESALQDLENRADR